MSVSPGQRFRDAVAANSPLQIGGVINGFAARLGFVVGGQSFLAHVAEGRIEIAAETPDTADVVLAAAPLRVRHG